MIARPCRRNSGRRVSGSPAWALIFQKDDVLGFQRRDDSALPVVVDAD